MSELSGKKIRIARPSLNLVLAEQFYCGVLGMTSLGHFENHDGFDGIMLGFPDAPYHLEFTRHRDSPVTPSSTAEDLFVFYIPSTVEWTTLIDRIEQSGHKPVASFNPYWDKQGRIYLDPDGYRIVIENGEWGR